MATCDPLDPDSWPEGYICVQREGVWTLESKAVEKKKSPTNMILIGGAIGLLIGIMLSRGNR